MDIPTLRGGTVIHYGTMRPPNASKDHLFFIHVKEQAEIPCVVGATFEHFQDVLKELGARDANFEVGVFKHLLVCCTETSNRQKETGQSGGGEN